MTRNILFRGKRLDTGEWVQGHLTDTCYGLYILTEPLYHVDGGEWNVGGHQVDPDTIGQFVGVTDKHGAKIFEDDFIEQSHAHLGFTTLYLVEWGQFNEVEGSAIGFVNISNEDAKRCEIVGNRYHTPELLTEAA